VDDRVLRGSLTANWTETPLIAETLAFVQETDHSAFWDVLDAISSTNAKLDTADEILEFAKQYIEPELLTLLNFSLDLRFYSPRIELHRRLLDGSPVGVRCRNSVVANLESLSSCESDFFDFEPVFGHGNASIILYIDITLRNWRGTLQRLQSLDDKFRFVVRPIGFSGAPMPLRGYSFQLKPFKYSMEFHVKDETARIRSASTGTGVFGGTFPLPVNLSQSYKPIKKDKLPFQVAQFIKNSTDPINTLRELLTNFPLFAQQINKIKVTDSLRRSFHRNGQFVDPGQSALFVNGRRVTDLNLFQIYETLLEEYRINQVLRDTLELDDFSIRAFRKTGTQPRIPKFPMVDTRSKLLVYWMNDLETDEKYQARLPKSLIGFATDASKWPLVARNAANAIFLLDPSDPDDLATIANLDELVTSLYPVRLGYILSPSKRSPIAKKIYYAYAHVVVKYGMKVAHKMLMRVNDMRDFDAKTRKRGPVKAQFWEQAFGSTASERRSPSFKSIGDLYKAGKRENTVRVPSWN
jgi:UDP-glucose:glycoprotein glucosyltransferase